MTIKLNNLTIAYGQLDVLSGLSIEIDTGILSVEGKNGSGKSTLLKVLGGSLIPKTGEILVDGLNLKYGHFAKQNVSVCPEVNELPNLLTASQYLRIVARLRLVEDYEIIASIANFLDFDLESQKPISDYSRGMRQKLCILATFMGMRRMLLFDESFSSVDQESRKQLLQNLDAIVDQSAIEYIVMVNHNPDHNFVKSKLQRIVCENMHISNVET